MAAAGPGHPSRDTGLPPGVEVGPLGRRFAAYLIEALVPAIVAVVLVIMLPGAAGTVRAMLAILGALVGVGWALTLWYMLAERAAGPGMRAVKLQLVGFYDGRPIGWMRVLARALVFLGLSITGIGLVLMLVFLVLHPRKQGWHDLVAGAVVIRERVLAPPASRAAVAQHATFTPEPSAALSGGRGATARQAQPGQEPGQAQPAAPTYGPVTRYSPVPGGSGSGSSAAPGGPPPGLGYPPRTDQLYPPRPPRPPGPPGPPVVPAGPPASTDTAPPPAPAVPSEPPSAPEPRAERTQPHSSASAPPAAEPTPPTMEWSAVLDDGRQLVIDHLVLLGRNPQPAPGEEDAELIKIADDTRTVSKLHLAVGVDPAGLYVVDRGSTNGSTVTTPNGATRRCTPGEVVYVSAGSIVSMGDHWLEVRRNET